MNIEQKNNTHIYKFQSKHRLFASSSSHSPRCGRRRLAHSPGVGPGRRVAQSLDLAFVLGTHHLLVHVKCKVIFFLFFFFLFFQMCGCMCFLSIFAHLAVDGKHLGADDQTGNVRCAAALDAAHRAALDLESKALFV